MVCVCIYIYIYIYIYLLRIYIYLLRIAYWVHAWWISWSCAIFVLTEQIIVVKAYNVKDYKIGRILERPERAKTAIEFDLVISSL